MCAVQVGLIFKQVFIFCIKRKSKQKKKKNTPMDAYTLWCDKLCMINSLISVAKTERNIQE